MKDGSCQSIYIVYQDFILAICFGVGYFSHVLPISLSRIHPNGKVIRRSVSIHVLLNAIEERYEAIKVALCKRFAAPLKRRALTVLEETFRVGRQTPTTEKWNRVKVAHV
jgi:hypothetical protein